MRERLIYQHLLDRRDGRADFESLPERTTFLSPTAPVTGRHIHTPLGEAWQQPSRTIASRTPPARSRGFCRGSMVDPGSNRELVFESALERNFACMLLADCRVVHVHDQPPAVEYTSMDGRWHQHTFDFLVTTQDGTRIAFAVKPSARVDKSGIKTVLGLIRNQHPDFADRILLRTEQHITKTKAFNTRLILRSRRGRNDEDVDTVRHVATTIHGRMRIDDLVGLTGLEGRGFNAVVCLIDDGVLALDGNGRIEHRALVRRVVPNLQ